MTDNEFIDQLDEIAMDKAEDCDGQAHLLPEPFRTLAIIFSAQGVIDNGGLIYFFENDWPGTPDYEVFIEAYKNIGMVDCALCLASAVSAFEVDRPHENLEARRQFIEVNYDEGSFEVKGWNDVICGNESVWVKLAKWAKVQKEFREYSPSNP